MLKKRTLLRYSSILLALCIFMSIFSASALAAFADNELAIEVSQGLEATPDPIDPQSWALNRDLTWEDYHPNPVIDWMTELNPLSLARPSAVSNPTNPEINRKIQGGLIMIDYLDRKFISAQPRNTDPTGYYRYLEGGTKRGMEDEVTRNPIVSATELIANDKYEGDLSKVTDADFGQWWADFLNKPQQLNNFASIDEYFRENTFGRWAIDLIPYGPFTIPYFEFETMGYDQGSNFQTYRDVPPSFRPGTSGTGRSSTFDSIAIPFARDAGVPYANLDFFFMLHAGYDESGVWQQLGIAQFASRKEIPYDLGPGPRMTQAEEFFTENPSYLPTYVARYTNTPSAAFWAGELAKYEELVTAGTPELYKFKLQQADWDWVDGYNDQTTRNTRYVAYTCWAAAVGEWSHMSTASAGNTGAGRSIRYSTQGENDPMATFAHEFGHIGELPDQYQMMYTINNSPMTEPWDIMSQGCVGGPFGYHARWQIPGLQGGSMPANFTMRNRIALKSYDMADANPSGTLAATGASANDILEIKISDLATGTPLVVDIVARNIPLNNAGLYPQLNQYGLISPNFYKGVQLAFDYSTNAATQAALPYRDKAPKKITGWTWTHRTNGSNLNTDQPARWMGIEVVDLNGYDSFSPDHGVLLTRIGHETASGGGFSWNIIDSHLYDIGLVDYVLPGVNGNPDDYVAHTIGQGFHLWDGAFHAGKSFVDTGYYRSEYDPADPHYDEDAPRKLNTSTFDVEWKKAMIKPGSIQRWEPQDGREIASGDTVNEFYDPYNDLHFYVLSYNQHDGRTLPGKTEPEQFISYTMGVIHGETPAVGGELQIVSSKLVTADPGNVAVMEYTVKQVGGDSKDIMRITLGGDLSWNTTLLNDLYAIGPDEEITIPVYIEIPELLNNVSNQSLTFTASSETNSAKKAVATVENITDIAPNLELQLHLDRVHLDAEGYFNVETYLTKSIESNVVVLDYAYDQTKIDYANVTLPAGAELISWKRTDAGVQLMIMVQDYNMKEIAKVMFQAKEQLTATEDLFVAVGSFVVKGADEKTVITLSSNLDFDPPDYPPFDLIYLSNVIDAFGAKNTDANWPQYKRYDFDNNGIINILDVAFAASHI